MKRIRLAIGIAGLALAAIGLAVPAAQAGTSNTAAPPAASTSVSSSCTGKTPTSVINSNHIDLKFWYRSDGCIGTVRITVYPGNGSKCYYPEIRIYKDGKREYFWYYGSPHRPVPVCSTTTIYQGVRVKFPNPVTVCARAPITDGGSAKLGPACATVN